jgi:hypothetical protein
LHNFAELQQAPLAHLTLPLSFSVQRGEIQIGEKIKNKRKKKEDEE